MSRSLVVKFDLWTNLTFTQFLERVNATGGQTPHHSEISAGFGIYKRFPIPDFGEYLNHERDCDIAGFVSSDERPHRLDHAATATIVAKFVADVVTDPQVRLAAVGYEEIELLAVKTPELVILPRYDLGATFLWQMEHTELFYAPAIRAALTSVGQSYIEVDMPLTPDGVPSSVDFVQSIGGPYPPMT